MSYENSTVDDDDVVLARLALELESAGNLEEVMKRYCAEYPFLETRIRDICQMWLELQKNGMESSSLEGTRLGSFTLEQRIGQGMSVVFAAKEDPPLNRRVAVKIMRPERHVSEKDKKRFALEQELLARLNVPHIVPVLQTGYASGLQYFVMPLIEGASLRHVARAAHQVTTANPRSTCPGVGELAKRFAETSGLSNGAPEINKSNGLRDADGSTANVLWSGRPKSNGESDAATSKSSTASRSTLRLSQSYFKSVAKVLSDVAGAVHNVHTIGVLHRDIKPSNIMVTTEGEGRLIDLGLAAYTGKQASETSHNGEVGSNGSATVTEKTVICGTPPYMAPEQFQGQADQRTDVWGLGVTLYELLTLRRAFPDTYDEAEGKPRGSLGERIETQQPVRPRKIVGNVPPDLEAICLKALRKNPSERYQSAEAFSNDLKCWLNKKPCDAWPPGWKRWLHGPGSPRAVWLLCRRRPADVFAALVLAMAIIAGLFATIASLRNRAVAAEQRQLHIQLQSIQQSRRISHTDGWSGDAWSITRDLARQAHDPLIRDEAAATLLGWDAKVIKQFSTPATSLAFDSQGSRLLMGGWNDEKGQPAGPAQLWDRKTDRIARSRQPGPGPVAFGAGGAPLQLVTDTNNRWRLLLWDVERQELRQSFLLLSQAAPSPAFAHDMPAIAISPDGRLVAASAKLPESLMPHIPATVPPTERGGVTVVWETASGRELHRDSVHAKTLAFSADGEFLASYVGELIRYVIIRSTSNGDVLTRQSTGSAEVRAIAFGRDPRPATTASSPVGKWRLAAGHAGGRITIWNLRDGTLVAQCRGSNYDVSSVDFNPDGTLLVSTGRREARLWDVATGRHLLTFGTQNNTLPAVRFSPDGSQVALCAVAVFGSPNGVQVWQLENGRGITALHGLAGPVAKVCYSPGEHFIAALTQDWQVGIWELPAGTLRHLIDVPQGYFADNAALAFSADGRQFAYSTADRAMLWNVDTGESIKEWSLPPGLGDQLAFHSSGKLLSMRFETQGKEFPPFGDVPWKEHPRVVRLRDLLSVNPGESMEISAFNRGVLQSAMARNGAHVVIEGWGGPGGRQRTIRAFDGPTAEERWSIDAGQATHGGWLQADPSGNLIGVSPAGSQATIVKLPNGELERVLADESDALPVALGPAADYRMTYTTWPQSGYRLYRGESPTPVVVLGLGMDSAAITVQFNSAGTHFAWGDTEGTTYICDLRKIQSRLAAIGFGW